jgi:hypothetical protein
MNAAHTGAAVPTDEDDGAPLQDVQAAYKRVSALVELLGACEPGQQVTGIFIHGLLQDVRMYLGQALDDLRPMATLRHSQAA